MEARKITIISTKTQKKSVVMSEAETLAQLKQDLRNANIDYEDMTFYEGTSKTELKSDDSVLPKDVPYTSRVTGQTTITNELVFMLTNTNKKIRSGVDYTRSELYTYVKNRNLQFECLKKFGKQYTNCSNSQLQEVVAATMMSDTTKPDTTVASNTNLEKAFNKLVDVLYEHDFIDSPEYEEIRNCMCVSNTTKKPVISSYSDSEIDDMFEGML